MWNAVFVHAEINKMQIDCFMYEITQTHSIALKNYLN